MEASEAAELLDALLARLPEGARADARIDGGRLGAMRFANGWLHQPHLEEIAELSLRIALGQKLATVTTLDLSPEGQAKVLREGLALARSAPEEPAFPGFPKPDGRPPATPYSRATGALTPDDQVRWTTRMLDAAAAAAPGARVSGVAYFGDTWRAVANTSGRAVRGRRSIVATRVLVERLSIDGVPSGWCDEAHFDHRLIDPERVGRQAAERAATRPPEPVKPGRYRVVLDGSAAAKLVAELGYLGFGARGAEEGWSCLAKRRGRPIAPSGFNVVDDARSPWTVPQSIDAEGMSKRRTPLIVRGRAGAPVADLLSAARRKTRPTGHAWPPQAPWGEYGAIPQNPIVAPGAAKDLEELIRETRRGLLVTRFHYVRTVHAGKAILTGMTRDGTYRIEKGEIVAPVRNLRFTESILTALAGLELWARTRRRYADDDERGAVVTTAPPVLTRAFRFTSATVF